MRKVVLVTTVLALFMSLAAVAQAQVLFDKDLTLDWSTAKTPPKAAHLIIDRTQQGSQWLWTYTVSGFEGSINDFSSTWNSGVSITNVTTDKRVTFLSEDTDSQWSWTLKNNGQQANYTPVEIKILTNAGFVSWNDNDYTLLEKNGVTALSSGNAPTPASTPEPGTLTAMLAMVTPAAFLLRRKKA